MNRAVSISLIDKPFSLERPPEIRIGTGTGQAMGALPPHLRQRDASLWNPLLAVDPGLAENPSAFSSEFTEESTKNLQMCHGVFMKTNCFARQSVI